MMIFYKIFGNDSTFTLGAFPEPMIARIIAGLASRPNVSQIWIT